MLLLRTQEGQRGCAFVRYAVQQSCSNVIDALHGKYAAGQSGAERSLRGTDRCDGTSDSGAAPCAGMP